MFERFKPSLLADSLDRITVEQLMNAGIRGLIIDLDNTMTPWNQMEVEPHVQDWFQQIHKAGIKTCVVSNNKQRLRVETVAQRLGIPFVFRASKPRRRAFRAGIALLGTGVKDTAVIGDQIFTDILGGNRLGLYTILVSPISTREFIGTRFSRYMERLLFWLMRQFQAAGTESSKIR